MNLEVSNLSFAYSKRGRPILDDVSFSVKKGDLLAVLGPNGVGKSTMFRCILGFGITWEHPAGWRRSSLLIIRDRSMSPHPSPRIRLCYMDVVLMGYQSTGSVRRQQKHIDGRNGLEPGISISGCRIREISGGERQPLNLGCAEGKILIRMSRRQIDYGSQFR